MTQRTRACGSWPSPLDAADVASAGVRLSEPRLDGGNIHWLERRPSEGGRTVLVRRNPDGRVEDVLEAGFNVRTRVHEYGGGAYTVHAGHVWFVHDGDGAVWHRPPSEPARRLTEPGVAAFADLQVDATRRRLICVREDYSETPPAAALVAIDWQEGRVDVLQEGWDFYASPRVSPDGDSMAWLCWNNPFMPWDDAACYRGRFDAAGRLAGVQHVAGGGDESIFQPQWSPDGILHLVSDRDEWWNLYRAEEDGLTALAPRQAEFGLPQWVFGQSTYAFAGPEEIHCACTESGSWHLARWTPGDGLLTRPVGLTEISGLVCDGDELVFIGASPERSATIMRLESGEDRPEAVRESTSIALSPACLSRPEPVTFPTTEGELAHALFYPPANPDCRPLEGELPPLLVKSHGGPTGATSTAFDPRIQFWTSRGIAVLDVNYRGSTGYGRTYRRRLYGNWGRFDVADCVAGARHLAGRGRVDGERLLISGSSAGGYTVLCALAFHDAFAAGASYYGVADLVGLMRMTHKFEAHYTDQLIGPWPRERMRYMARSPLEHAQDIACPVLFLQGLEDKVVPPAQTEAMVAALEKKGLPHACVTFPGEQHGFRKGENVQRALAAEWVFYGRVLGFPTPSALPPLEIRNEPAA